VTAALCDRGIKVLRGRIHLDPHVKRHTSAAAA
jgi:hypothetical protein